MGRSVSHANRDDGKTLCGRFNSLDVIHVITDFHQKSQHGELLAQHVTCKNCNRIKKASKNELG